MPKFLSKREIYLLISRELPENVYAFSSKPEEHYTTADDFAFAKTMESYYTNMSRVYANYFPQDTEESISDWEITVFGELDSFGKTLEERRDAVLTKIRSRKGITVQDIKDIVLAVIGSDKNVEIIEKGCESGAWILGKSNLSRNTYLGISSTSGISIPSDFDPCEDDPASIGLTPEQLQELQDQAYAYEVRVIGYDATQEERDKLDAELIKFEPARSTHTIVSPFELPEIKEPWRLSRSKLGSRTYLG